MIVEWLIVWNWVEFETFWKFNEREWNDFPRLSFWLLISGDSNSFHHHNTSVKMTSLLPFEMKRVFEKKRIFEFHLKVFQIHKLYATQWFSWGKIKWLLQSIWNMSWKYEERFEDGLNFLNSKPFGVIWFISNYFSPKLNYMENRVKWFPTL